VTNNRRRTRRAKGRRLQRKRSELVERTFAHMCETGGARRSWLCGIEKVKKRWLVQGAARNLGLVLRKLFGIGTARTLQDAGRLALRAYAAGFIILRYLHHSATQAVLNTVNHIPRSPFAVAM